MQQSRWVYPRMRGGAFSGISSTSMTPGLSPHARGSHFPAHPAPAASGSIPACAGEPNGDGDADRLFRVYPRMRGGASFSGGRTSAYMGLSPHARGSRHRWQRGVYHPGSIPACAGEPASARLDFPSDGVYPRMRGGAVAIRQQRQQSPGLSPHARGSLQQEFADGYIEGSIPACAGEPPSQRVEAWASTVYPRMRGGASSC